MVSSQNYIFIILPSITIGISKDLGRFFGLDGGVYLSSTIRGLTIDSDKRGT